MPNWVVNKLELEGNNVEEIVDKHIVKDSYGSDMFDFNTIIKMPESLNIESGSRSFDGMKLYIAKINPLIKNIGAKEEKMPSLESFIARMERDFHADDIQNYILKPKEVNELKVKYGEKFEDVVELGEKILNNYEKYRCIDWYDWRIQNWGTKWNANATSISKDKKTIFFDTAWSPPVNVIEEFSKMHPSIKIVHTYAEEQPGIYAGKHVYKDGEPYSREDYKENSKESFDTYFDLWGRIDVYAYDEEKGTYVYVDDEEEME